MKINILDIIDFEKVDALLEGFNKSTGFVTAILDLEGNVLSKSGWRQMCTHFHRVNPETSKMCTISDTVLAGKMAEGEKYHFYKCLNGLVDVAVPIIINDEHIGNLFSGQFFFERPDREFFKKQAEKYRFDEKKYLEAFDKVPAVSMEEVQTAMDFLQNMTQLISETAFQKLEQMELNLTISVKEEQHRMILETANDGFCLMDLQGKLLEVNDAYCRLSGYTKPELLKLSIFDLEIVETAEQTQKHLQKVLETGKDRFETKHRCKNGQIVDVELSVKFQSTQNLIVLFVRDITDRKQAEENLRTSEAKFRAVAELSPMAIYASSGPDQKGIYINEAFYKIFGFSLEDVPTVGEWWIKAFPDEKYRQQVIDQWVYNIEQADKKNTVVEVLECVCMCRDGSGKNIAWVGKTINEEFWAFGYDFTERKQAEEALIISKKLLSETEKIGKVGGWEFNIDTMDLIWTDEVYNIHEIELNSNQNVEKGINFYTPESKPVIEKALQRAIEFGETFDLKLEIITAKGNRRNVHTIGKADLDHRRVYGFFQDITERKLAEQKVLESQAELKKAYEESNRSRQSLLSVLEDQQRTHLEINTLNTELEQRVIERTTQLEFANKELESFSYSVSHDLRAPLRGIDGFSLALFEDYYNDLDDTAKNYIERIRMATKKMDGLIDSLLKLSRISRFEMNLEEINLSAMVQEITKELKEDYKTRKAQFIIQKNITIFGDNNLMKIALENLLNNAWKFTSKKENTIIEFGAFKENSKTVYFVKDNGIGFDMKYADKLFSVFQRLHSEKDYPGTGIGLTTVQRIIRRHNGDIRVESKLNEGTTFYLTL